MKTLIVDNRINQVGVSSVVGAVKLFSEYEVVSYEAIKPSFKVGKNVDALVFTGSRARIVSREDMAKFSEVIGLIRRVDLPILGICFGHQLLALALGTKVASLKEPVMNRFEKVRVLEADELFRGFKNGDRAILAESHYDYVKKDGLSECGFQLLADSPSCEVEAIKHRHKPFYGVQFHPERLKIGDEERKDGLNVIKNFYHFVSR